MPTVGMEFLHNRAQSLGLYVVAGRGGGRGGLYKIFDKPDQDWFSGNNIHTLKGKNEVEAFLDGYLLGQQSHGKKKLPKSRPAFDR